MRVLAVRVLAFRVFAFPVFGTASMVLSIALAGGVAAGPTGETATTPECEASGDAAKAESAPYAKTSAAQGVAAPKCAAERVAQKRPSFDDLLEGREVVPLNTRGYNYKRPDEIRGEVPSRNSAPPSGVPARKERKPDPSP